MDEPPDRRRRPSLDAILWIFVAVVVIASVLYQIYAFW